MHKYTARFAVTLAALSSLATGCAKSIDGAWRGVCELETTRGNDAPTTEQVPVVATATKGAEGRYALSLQLGPSIMCQNSGAQTTQENGSTVLYFAAMPCTGVGGSRGAPGQFTLRRGSNTRLTGGLSASGSSIRISSDCQLAQ